MTDQIIDDLTQLIEQGARDFGLELRQSGREVAQFAAAQAELLQQVLVENPETFEEALRASRDSTVLFAAAQAIDAADSASQRMVGFFQALLGTTARLLVAI